MEYNTDRGIACVRIFLVDDETAIPQFLKIVLDGEGKRSPLYGKVE